MVGLIPIQKLCNGGLLLYVRVRVRGRVRVRVRVNMSKSSKASKALGRQVSKVKRIQGQL